LQTSMFLADIEDKKYGAEILAIAANRKKI
jgi:hypothetical protein